MGRFRERWRCRCHVPTWVCFSAKRDPEISYLYGEYRETRQADRDGTKESIGSTTLASSVKGHRVALEE